MLSDLVMALPNITSLNLRHTKCSDQVLTQIGQCCKNLHELDIYGCPVTDMGVMSLCVSFDPKHPKVEKLLKLDIAFTAVSYKAVEIVLCNCKRLQILHYPDTCAAIYYMDAKGVFESVDYREPLRLQTLNLMMMKEMDCRPNDSLSISCLRCPFVTKVYIHRGITDEGVLHLAVLQHLKVLHLTNDNGEDITFEGGLLPLLQAAGSGLEEFAISEVNLLDIAVIGHCCPKLRKFICLTASFRFASFPMHTHPEITLQEGRGAPYQNLEELRLSIYNERNDFPAYFLQLILLNAKRLRELHLVHIQEFSDDLVKSVLEVNPLERLHRLSLDQCNRIGVEPIFDLLLAKNDLVSLSLRCCQELTRIDFEDLQRAVQVNRLEVVIDWS